MKIPELPLGQYLNYALTFSGKSIPAAHIEISLSWRISMPMETQISFPAECREDYPSIAIWEFPPMSNRLKQILRSRFDWIEIIPIHSIRRPWFGFNCLKKAYHLRSLISPEEQSAYWLMSSDPAVILRCGMVSMTAETQSVPASISTDCNQEHTCKRAKWRWWGNYCCIVSTSWKDIEHHTAHNIIEFHE